MEYIHCPDCESEKVTIENEEGSDTGDQAELVCDECGNIEVITRISLEDVFG